MARCFQLTVGPDEFVVLDHNPEDVWFVMSEDAILRLGRGVRYLIPLASVVDPAEVVRALRETYLRELGVEAPSILQVIVTDGRMGFGAGEGFDRGLYVGDKFDFEPV